MMYQLEKYEKITSRHECPRCHDKRSFTYYVDEAGNILDKLVGRCNHEVACGYHYTPGEWFHDHPEERERKAMLPPPKPKKRPKKKVCTIDMDYVKRSLSMRSDFVLFLTSILEREEIEQLMRTFWLGATRNVAVIYWQIDLDGKCRTGKIMRYDSWTGHRIKSGHGITWVHRILQDRGVLSEDWHLTQCLFGLHQLRKKDNDGKIIALVESEKTAIIGTACKPGYIWMACGGISQISEERCAGIKGREVVLFPDTDVDGMTYGLWCEKAKILEKLGCKVTVSDYLERTASAEDKAVKIDIGDVMIRELRERRKKAEGMLDRLIDTFKLEAYEDD